MQKREWFISNIGKKIYRDDSGCPCDTCKEILENGLIITDKEKADHLFYTQNDFMAEGLDLNYRDVK